MSKWILIGIALLGIIYNVILMYRKMKEIRAMPETEFGCSGEELWNQQKKHFWYNFIGPGIIANFFDTLVSDHLLRHRQCSKSASPAMTSSFLEHST